MAGPVLSGVVLAVGMYRLVGADKMDAVGAGHRAGQSLAPRRREGLGQVSAGSTGRVVAQLMLGFWRDLLESGGHVGAGPLRRRTDYEEIWRSDLRRALPGGRALAAAEGGRFTRTSTLAIVKEVHALRNRAAHHEPLVNGLPVPGESRRISVEQGGEACLRLAQVLDRDPASYLRVSSRLAAALEQRPG